MSQYKRVLKVGEQVEARLRSWTMGKTKGKGSPYIKVSFEGFISRNLWLSDKAMEQTMKTLEILGFNGSNLKMIAQDGALNAGKIFLVTIDEVRHVDKKIYYEASWINDPDKILSGFNNKDVTEDLLDELNIDTRAYIENAQDIEPPAATQPEYNVSSDPGFASDDIPF